MPLISQPRTTVRPALGIALVALAISLPFFGYMLELRKTEIARGDDPINILPIYGSDSSGYVVLAQNLIKNGALTSDTVPPFTPDTFRTPGYPALLALFVAPFGSVTFFPLVQILFVIGTGLLIARIGAGTFSSTVGIFAALLFVLDPTTVLHSLLISSDISFTFFLIAALYCIFFLKSKHSELALIAGGLLFGAATLIRPISLYLPILIIPFYCFLKRDLGWKKILRHSIIILVSIAILVVPWAARNKRVANTWGIASVKDFNMFFYTVPEYVSFRRGTSPDSVRAELFAKLAEHGIASNQIGDISNGKIITAIAQPYITADLFSYARWHLVKMVPFFLSSGLKNFFYIYNDIVRYPYHPTDNSNLTNFLMRGQFSAFFGVLGSQLLVTLEELFWVVIFLLMFVPLIPRKTRTCAVFFLGLIFYLALPTPPVAYSRFRIPAAPYMFLLATEGALILLPGIRRRYDKDAPKNEAILHHTS